ncbi:MAG: RsmE family RNA methyltransferase, partial [Bacteroidota bacterium]
MQLFYLPPVETNIISLPSEEARHAVQVLRKQVGDQLDLVDGKGGWYKGTIIAASKKQCQLQLELVKQEKARAAYRLIMLVSPTKSNERFEWFLEKATEIGVDEIVPIKCTRTERPRIRHDRYEKVLVSAMKQSLQAWLPKLHEFTSFQDALQLTSDLQQKYIGWCDDIVDQALIKKYSAPV